MPRRTVDTKVYGPFHIVSRCINREWFNIPMDQVWEIFQRQLYFFAHAFEIEIHSFVLMSNHYHMIVSTPKLNLSESMAYLQREVSRDLNLCGNRINRTFAGRYYKCSLTKFHHYANCYKYIYQNPLRAKIARNVVEYPYSTLPSLLGISKVVIPMCEDAMLFSGDLSAHLAWLNEEPSEEDIIAVRNALKKGEYKLRKHPGSRQANRLEYELL